MSPRTTHRRLPAAVLAALLALACAPAAASAATFSVSPLNDAPDAAPGDGECRTGPGDPDTRCGLRAAIQEANALPGGDVLKLETGDFEPATPLPVITTSVELTGNGSRATELDGGGLGPVLRTTGGAVVIRGMTIRGGRAADAQGGGGLLNAGAIVTLDEVALRGNVASATSGGARGGAVANRSGSLLITRSLLTANRAEPEGLGASGDGLGGAIFSDAPLTVINSTVHANAARGTLGAVGGGGGIAVAGSVAQLKHVTLSDNEAQTGPGGNLLTSAGANVELRDSILAGGSALAGSENCGGLAPLTSGRSIDSGATCGLGAAGLSNTSPLLEPLSASGGSIDSRAPLWDSPAIGAAAECALDRDQRGSRLPVGGACDLGAVDHSTDVAAGIAASRAIVPSGGEVTLTLNARSQGLDTAGGVAVTLELPPLVTFVRASGPAGPCSGPPFGGRNAVACPLGSARLGDVPAAFVTVRAPEAGTVTFASAVSTAGQGESETRNDIATLTLAVSTGDKLPKPPPQGKGPKRCSVTKRGAKGPDRMTGSEGSDRLLGGKGPDRIDGRGGADCLAGEQGNDVLIGGGGRDDLSGGGGADQIAARDGAPDVVRCGPGRDRVTADRSDRVARDCERVTRR